MIMGLSWSRSNKTTGKAIDTDFCMLMQANLNLSTADLTLFRAMDHFDLGELRKCGKILQENR
jgi:hypothetical protein